MTLVWARKRSTMPRTNGRMPGEVTGAGASPREVEQQRRQDADDQDRHHAHGEPDVASAEHGAEIDEARQRCLAALGRCCVGHAGRSIPSGARLKAVRSGWRATGTNEWSRARVQGWPRRVRWKGLRLPGKMCRVYGY